MNVGNAVRPWLQMQENAQANVFMASHEDESRPQRLNLLHFEERHLGQAHWLMENSTLSNDAPADALDPLRLAGRFGNEPVTVLTWSMCQYLVAPATRTAAPAPEVHLLADDCGAGGRMRQLQV